MKVTDIGDLISIIERWTITDKIAAAALLVASISLLLSIIPAITSVTQAWIAYLEFKAERENREAAINASMMVPTMWPANYTALILSVKNRSEFFIEVRRVRLRAPRQLRIAYMPNDELAELDPKPIDPRSLDYSRSISVGDTLVRPAESTAGWGGDNDRPTDSTDFRFALTPPPTRMRKVRVKLLVDVARSNRHRRPTTVPVHFDIDPFWWISGRD